MINQPNRPVLPIWLGEQLHQISLDLYRVALLGKAKSGSKALHMGVDRYSGVDAKGVS